MAYGADIVDLDARRRRCRLTRGGVAVGAGEALALLVEDAALRAWLTGTIAAAPFEALFWETPPLTRAVAAAPFEFMLIDSPALARAAADPGPFAEWFSDQPVVDFPSLGGDAHLLAPCPHGADDDCAHLAAFLRRAPATRADALWRRAAELVLARQSDAPLWLSTSGLGVPWLHVRLGTRPKYYAHAPYRQAP